MDKSTILLLLCLLGTFCKTNGLTLGLHSKSQYMVHPGGPLTLRCYLDEGLKIILEYRLEWIHVSLVDPLSPQETVLATQGTLEPSAPRDKYEVSVEYDDAIKNVNMTFTIKNVENANDGHILCRATPTKDPGAETLTNTIDLVVVSDVDSVEMTFDGEGPITSEVQTQVEREEGDYGVTCSTEGFSPSADLRIFLGQEEQTTGGTTMVVDGAASRAAGARRYMATTTAMSLQLRADHSGQTLRCDARAIHEGLDDPKALTASIPLLVIALEPTITCDKNVTARVDDLYVKLRCVVDHPNLEIDRYSFEIGETGEVITPGKVNKYFDEVHVEQIGHHQTEVVLDLYKVEEWHFNSYYYLDVYSKSGQKFRERTSIIMLESSRSCVLTVSKAAMLVPVFLISLLLSL